MTNKTAKEKINEKGGNHPNGKTPITEIKKYLNKGTKTSKTTAETIVMATKILNDNKIAVEVRKNIDKKGVEDNIDVKVSSKLDDDERKLSLNGVLDSIQYVINFLINMGFKLTDKAAMDAIGKAIQIYVMDKVVSKTYNLLHERIGWGTYKGEKIFKLHNIISKDRTTESEYVGNLKIKRKGKIEDYIRDIKQLVVGRPKLEIAFILGVYGILLQAMNLPDCNLLINFYGKGSKEKVRDTSGIGKTIATKLCLQWFGNANELFRTYNATDNKIEAEMAEFTVIPMVIDDKMVNSIGASKRRVMSDMVKFIFRFVTGRVKGRLHDANCKSYEKIYGPTVISTESSIADKLLEAEINGEFSRIIEIPISRGELTESSTHARQLDKFISRYAGLGAEAFVQWLFQKDLVGEKLTEKYEEWVDTLNDGSLGNNPVTSRVSNKVGVIMLAADLINSAFELGMDIARIQKTLENCIMEVKEKTEFADRAYEEFLKYCKDNIKRFAKSSSECVEGDDDSIESYIGHYKMNEKGSWEVWILGKGLEKVFNNYEKADLDMILSSWKRSGIITSGREKESRRTTRLTFYKKQRQKNVYIIEVPELY